MAHCRAGTSSGHPRKTWRTCPYIHTCLSVLLQRLQQKAAQASLHCFCLHIQAMHPSVCKSNMGQRCLQRYYCKQCERHWTAGGTLRKVEAGAGRRNPRKKSAQRSKGSRSRSKTTPSKSAGSDCGDDSLPADTGNEPSQDAPGAFAAEPPLTRAPPLRQHWPGKVGPAESTAGVGAAGVYSNTAPGHDDAPRAAAYQVCIAAQPCLVSCRSTLKNTYTLSTEFVCVIAHHARMCVHQLLLRCCPCERFVFCVSW